MNTGPEDKDRLAEAGQDERYRVDARGAEGLLVGDQGTQINYFYNRTWTDGVAPAPLVSMSGTITSPYRGLNAFGERDVALFFGRESAATEVLERMSRRLDGAGLMVVSGVSGAGKSSLLRAGVLPRLRGAGLESAAEAASWPCLVFTPGRRPLEELAVRVAPVAGADAAAVLPGLSADPAGFALTARQAALAHLGTPMQDGGVPDEQRQQRLLLIVDQFEQLFTQCENENERQAFITALHAAATRSDRRCPAAVVVLLVRADFEARLADYPLLAPAVQDRYLLTAMTGRQLRMAIVQPAVMAGSGVDDDLVQVLLEEVRTRPGSSAASTSGTAIGAGVLPLLSHALDQAWRGRTGQALTLADYERTGGIEGAVASSAQRAYDRLTPAQHTMARQVFTRLTATTSDGVDTAARATRADLTNGKDETQISDTETVLETFTAERLLTLAAGTVEISHEALLTAWPLLRDTWLADTHADRVIRSRLQATAEEWTRASRDPSYLYSGSRLEIAVDAAARIAADARQAPLGQAEEDFLRASRHGSRTRTRRRQGLIATLLALVVGLAAVSVAAVNGSHASAHQRDIAISGELVSDSEALGDTNATVSQLESIAAWGIYPSAQAYYAMLIAAASPEIATFTSESGSVNSTAFSPDGKTLAIGGANGSIQLWNVATGRQIRSLATGFAEVTTVAFSPDGKTLAIGDSAIDANDATVQLWNLPTGRRIRSLTIGSDVVWSVAFSPDGTTLAIGYRNPGDSNTTAELWNLATSRQVRSLSTGSNSSVTSVAFSPDGTTLATGDDDGTARLWNPATGRQIRSLTTGSAKVESVAFSPDGTTLATGDVLGTAVFDLATGRQVGTPFTGIGEVKSVAFSPDGKTLAIGDADGTVRMLATEGTDGRVQVLDMPADAHIASVLNDVTSVAFSPDGKILVTGNGDGTAQLWNAASGRQIRSLTISAHGIYSVAFSPDGKTLAFGGATDIVQLWNVATGRQIRSVTTSSGPVWSVAFSPDGKTLAFGDNDSTAELWNVATGRQIRSLTTSSGIVNSVAFSPDGKTLTTGDDSGTAELWNVATGRPIRSLTTGSDNVDSVAFSPDGKTLVTGDSDSTARLWDVATGQQVRHLTTGANSPVASVAFSPDGKTVASGDGNATAELWNVSYLVDVLPLLCSRVGGSVSQAEWAQYVPAGPAYRNVCTQHS